MKAKFIDFLISIFILALVAVALFFAVDAKSAEPDQAGATISLTAEEAKNCDDEGGCFLMTQKMTEEIIEYIRAMKAIKESCGKQI